jgi:hypothetical protein
MAKSLTIGLGKFSFMDHFHTLITKLFGVFVKSETIESPQTKWSDNLQWNGGRYLSQREITELANSLNIIEES